MVSNLEMRGKLFFLGRLRNKGLGKSDLCWGRCGRWAWCTVVGGSFCPLFVSVSWLFGGVGFVRGGKCSKLRVWGVWLLLISGGELVGREGEGFGSCFVMVRADA